MSSTLPDENSAARGPKQRSRPVTKESLSRAEQSKTEATHDAVLVQRFIDGDESAFVEIVERHHEKIFSTVISLLKNRADAEEIVQDTFVRAYRGLVRFRG